MSALKVSKAEALRLLEQQIERGNDLRVAAEGVRSSDAFDSWNLDNRRWEKFTSAVLKRIYDDEDPDKEFVASHTHMVFAAGGGWTSDLQDDYKDVGRGINVLRSLIERLVLLDEPSLAHTATDVDKTLPEGDPVIFIVHGHDHGTRETVARFLEKAGPDYEVVILDEQASKGRTLIEKFEQHGSASSYAVVLLTPDDVGGPKPGSETNPRARQNVVFELGFFVGKLGRDKVAVLIEDGVEKPSDIQGLVYISLTDWKRALVRELKAAGLDYSLDRV